jgi:hypothetical protein
VSIGRAENDLAENQRRGRLHNKNRERRGAERNRLPLSRRHASREEDRRDTCVNDFTPQQASRRSDSHGNPGHAIPKRADNSRCHRRDPEPLMNCREFRIQRSDHDRQQRENGGRHV